MPYTCPICQTPLTQQSVKSYFCENNHCFDLAKEGYLNLLPAQHKKSKEPGDSRAMIQARRNFLEAGFYLPLAKTLATLVDELIVNYSNNSIPHSILDLGCGEGYYSRQIEAQCKTNHLDLHGIDIAKNAILVAAKKQPNAHFVVASNNHAPYIDSYFDFLIKIYAPSSDAEIIRLVKMGGIIIFVTPGPRHLWQLKGFIYKEVKEHEDNVTLPTGFKQIETQIINFKIQPSQQQRMDLLQMTPFAWQAKKEMKSNLQQANGLEIDISFIVTTAYKR